MTLPGRSSLRARLYFATAFSLLLLVAIGLLGYLALDGARATVQGLFAQQVHALTAMAELRTDLAQLRRLEKDIIINFNNSAEVEELRGAWAQQLARVRDGLQRARPAEGADSQATFVAGLEQAQAELGRYVEGIVPIFEQIERAQVDGAGAGAYAERLKASMEAADGALAGLSGQARERMDEARERLDARSATMALLIAAAVVLALLVLLPLTLLTVRSVTGGLLQARALAERIAAGDLSRQVQATRSDEVGLLIGAMGGMQQALQALVGQVQQAAGGISSASSEIALGNQDLSQRTEQAAASLQQTASSMEVLTGTVQQSAGSAHAASRLAASAAEVAERGGTVVAQVVHTMGEISESSRRIGDITGVIDSIAFQTNILALNAAVEAARAGDSGRGFAVVASEVRSLAQRSAEAAREIRQLIDASAERVAGGSRLVGEAGETMTQIVEGVRQVAAIVAEITEGATLQSDNIGQINQSVAHLDRMTQQNAALVEESAAASSSLNEQARQLAQSAARFQLGEVGVRGPGTWGAAADGSAPPAGVAAGALLPPTLVAG
ncbi:methyl-accepting chemotaxis protein [Melaminivora sp.]|uniref:methyl-accepting chemotaxis protein n=1 Tax=Melaminivora sp. TaxID=1933032 RepID=UPI0028AB2934|nr:methyl-accepting chemotaxis protein [Melaminivora sp.]